MAGRDMVLQVTGQQGRNLTGRAEIPGGSFPVSGALNADGKTFHLSEVGGATAFDGFVVEKEGGMNMQGTWKKSADGQEYHMFLVRLP